LAQLIDKAQQLSDRMERLKKGNMKVIGIEVEELKAEINLKT